MNEVLIVGVPAVLVIIALVEWFKGEFGLASRWAPVASIGLGLVVTVGNQLVQLYPAAAGWYEAVWMGVLVGLIASGLYDVGKVSVAGK